MKTNDCRFSKE